VVVANNEQQSYGFTLFCPHHHHFKKHFLKSGLLKPKMNIFVPFYVRPYDAFNICEEGSNVWSWIIEHLFMHEHVDAHALLS
jgi:hypothetical protein